MKHTPRVVRAWLSVYTAGLPATIAAERRAEIDSDVFEHLHSGAGAAPRHAQLSVVGRAARGAVDDISWRNEMRRMMKHQPTDGQRTGFPAVWAAITQAWFAPAAALLAMFYVAMAVAIARDGGTKMPDRAAAPLLMLAFAVALAVGLHLRRTGATASDEGLAQPQPRGRRSLVGEALLIVGTLPGLGFWWMIVPAVLGVLVIAGVFATRPAARRASAA
jgi:hypothetical protein